MSTPVVTRFAPSPTGPLHRGHAFSALTAFGFARARSGLFRLRIEDLDGGRSRPEFEAAIFEDLEWLGLRIDGPVMRQSERSPAYAAALQKLEAAGAIYPCFCTRSDIASAAAAPHGPDGPLYPGTCRGISGEERRTRLAAEAHAWRLDSGAAAALTGPLSFRSNGETVEADPALLGDAVLARKDAAAAYHLAAVVDDAAQGVTDVVRGEDLLPSTHVQRHVQALLGLPEPAYHHHPLVLGDDGERLAKRNGARSLASLRADGVEADALARELGVLE